MLIFFSKVWRPSDFSVIGLSDVDFLKYDLGQLENLYWRAKFAKSSAIWVFQWTLKSFDK